MFTTDDLVGAVLGTFFATVFVAILLFLFAYFFYLKPKIQRGRVDDTNRDRVDPRQTHVAASERQQHSQTRIPRDTGDRANGIHSAPMVAIPVDIKTTHLDGRRSNDDLHSNDVSDRPEHSGSQQKRRICAQIEERRRNCVDSSNRTTADARQHLDDSIAGSVGQRIGVEDVSVVNGLLESSDRRVGENVNDVVLYENNLIGRSQESFIEVGDERRIGDDAFGEKFAEVGCSEGEFHRQDSLRVCAQWIQPKIIDVSRGSESKGGVTYYIDLENMNGI